MAIGSIRVPGAIVMINDDVSDSYLGRLEIQLHIDETLTGEEFDLRVAGDPDYPNSIRVLRQRILVIRNHQDATNRELMDVILFIREGLASVSKNCFGPPGATFAVKDLYWGQLCVFDTDLNRSCSTSSGSCGAPYMNADGYASPSNSPYYPATYDPNFPAENHSYNQKTSGGTFGNTCGADPDKVLAGTYICTTEGCIPTLDIRLVKG